MESRKKSKNTSKNLPVVNAYHLKPSAPTIEELNRSYNSTNSKKNKKKN